MENKYKYKIIHISSGKITLHEIATFQIKYLSNQHALTRKKGKDSNLTAFLKLINFWNGSPEWKYIALTLE